MEALILVLIFYYAVKYIDSSDLSDEDYGYFFEEPIDKNKNKSK